MTIEYLESLSMIAAKATILFAAAGLAHAVFRGAAASVRHIVWTAAVCGALALPVLSAALPAWQVASLAPASPTLVREHARVAAPIGLPAASPVAREAATAAWPEWPAFLVAAWAVGALLVLARFAAGWVAMRRIARDAEPHAGWSAEVERLSARVGLTRRARVLVSPRLAIPVAWGTLRPMVLLPDDARSWSPERREIVLLHELAHVRRRDCATQALAHLACSLYWFNPLAWIAASRLRLERERAADDCVLAAGARASEYADHLVEIARAVRGGRATLSRSAAAAIASKSQLEERVRAILDAGRRRRTASRAVGLAVVLIVATAVVPFAAAHPFAAPTPVATPVTVEAAPSDMALPVPSAPSVAVPRPRGTALADRAESRPVTAPQEEAAGSDVSDGDVVAALEAALEDEDENVRRQAGWALKMIRMRDGEHVDFDDEPTRLRVKPRIRVRPGANPGNDSLPAEPEHEGDSR